MSRVITLSLLLTSFSTGCFQELDSGAADEFAEPQERDPNAGPTTALEDPTIGLDLDDEGLTTDDPCVKVKQDAHAVLGTYCATCHDQGDASSGVPKFDFVMDEQRLTQETWTVGAESRRFLVPGDPDSSWLYLRPLLGTMPPIQTDLRNADAPRPTISDLSVLREWITTCVGPPRVDPPDQPALDDARFNFEADTQGWIGLPEEVGEGGFMQVSTSMTEQFSGSASLAGSITSTGTAEYWMMVQDPGAIPAGTRVTFHVFLPPEAQIRSLEPYVTDAAGVYTASMWMYPQTGAWTTLTVMVPDDAVTITSLGIEFWTEGTWNGTVYLDSVDW